MTLVRNKYQTGQELYYFGDDGSIFSGEVRAIDAIQGNNYCKIKYILVGAHGEHLNEDELFTSYADAVVYRINNILANTVENLCAQYNETETEKIPYGKDQLFKDCLDLGVSNIYDILSESK